MTDTVGTRLRFLRGKASQDEFAAVLGVHKETIGKYERDKMQPGSDVLIRLRQERRVDINWLLTGEGESLSPAGAVAGDININALAGALAAVEELLQQRNMVLTAEKKGKVVAHVYKRLTRPGAEQKIELGMLNDLLDLAS